MSAIDNEAKAAESKEYTGLDDEALIAILRKEEQAAYNWQMAELTPVRERAFNYYDRNPTGDEQEGQSKIVTSEFADTIESLMPGMMRVFASSDAVVQFTPLAPQDEQWAQEATDYVPHVFMRENEGFKTLYWAIKDALSGRLGAVTVDIDETSESRTEPVASWTAEQIAAASMAADQQGITLDIDVQPDTATNVDPATGHPLPQTFSGTVTTTRKRKKVMVDTIAPEDVLFSPLARDIDEASFCGYRKRVTASYLRELGLSQDDVDQISDDRPVSVEERQRNASALLQDRERHDSERRYWVVVAYVKADLNGDGISEFLRVLYAHAGGEAGRIIEKEEWTDGPTPIALGTPILMPHTIVGRSIYDQVADLQEIGTAVTRGFLDNLYMTNRPRPTVSNRVNLNSVIDWTPGMPIQMLGNENPAEHISFLQVPSVMPAALQAMEYFSSIRENRTGVTRYNQGLDANSLNKTATGVQQIMSASQQRQELIARTFAETFIKRLMRLVYRAIKRAATGPVSYFDGEDFAQCDPTRWPDDMHLEVNVGLGTGNKQQQAQDFMLIGAMQEKIIMAQGGPVGPAVTLDHVVNTGRKLTEALGFKGTAEFVASPKEMANTPPSPPKPDPEMAKVQAKAQADQAALQAKAAADQQALQANIALKRMEMEADIQLQREKAAADMQIAREKAALDLQIAREKAALDAQLKQQELALEAGLEKYKIDTQPTPQAPQIKEQQVTSG